MFIRWSRHVFQFVPAGLESIDKSGDDIKTTLSNYIYGGPVQEMRVLRGQAWLWILVHPEWIFQWTQKLVNQCFDRNSTHFWNKDVSTKYRARVYQGQVKYWWIQNQVETSTSILCWLLYPSDDDRLADTLEHVRSWLQHTLKGDTMHWMFYFVLLLILISKKLKMLHEWVTRSMVHWKRSFVETLLWRFAWSCLYWCAYRLGRIKNM